MPEYRTLEAGAMDRLGSIERATTAVDAAGQPVETWATWAASVWAAIEPLNGREFFAARQFASEVTHRIRINYRAGVSAKMRYVYGSRYFRIEAVIDPSERHEQLHLMCTEVLA